MGWCGVLRAWLTVTVPLLVCVASEDDSPFLQRQVPFDLFLSGGSVLDSDVGESFTEIPESEPDVIASKENSPGHQARQIPEMAFPPARPSLDNLPFLCSYVDSRPRYKHESFPKSGSGWLIRRADAINRLESWYSGCCQNNETQESTLTLCCALQAWKTTLSDFCDEEFSVKTSHYYCCKKRGYFKWGCFEKAAPNPTYVPQGPAADTPPPQEPGFTFNRSICPRNASMMTSGNPQERNESYKAPYIRFPPGRPTSRNIGPICGFQAERPLYPQKCLPSEGYGWLALQYKVINQLETGIYRCCKREGEALACVEKKWKEEMDWFCMEEQYLKKVQEPCCQPQGERRYACFSRRAPNPDYMLEQRPVNFLERSPVRVCDTHATITKRFPVGFPIESMVTECCPLPAHDRITCVENRLDSMLNAMCAAKGASSSDLPPECCLQPPSRGTSNCLTQQLLKAIRKVAETPAYRSRTCPTD